MAIDDIIKEQKYKPYGYARVYYIRITDNTGYSSKLLYNTFKAICRKFNAKFIGVKSKGHGTKSFNKPHIHALILTDRAISLNEFLKLIPKGFHAKLWRIKSYSDLASSKKYIKDHIGKKKRGFLLNLEMLALRILIELWAILSMLKLLRIEPDLRDFYHAHQRALLEKLRGVILWRG